MCRNRKKGPSDWPKQSQGSSSKKPRAPGAPLGLFDDPGTPSKTFNKSRLARLFGKHPSSKSPNAPGSASSSGARKESASSASRRAPAASTGDSSQGNAPDNTPTRAPRRYPDPLSNGKPSPFSLSPARAAEIREIEEANRRQAQQMQDEADARDRADILEVRGIADRKAEIGRKRRAAAALKAQEQADADKPLQGAQAGAKLQAETEAERLKEVAAQRQAAAEAYQQRKKDKEAEEARKAKVEADKVAAEKQAADQASLRRRELADQTRIACERANAAKLESDRISKRSAAVLPPPHPGSFVVSGDDSDTDNSDASDSNDEPPANVFEKSPHKYRQSGSQLTAPKYIETRLRKVVCTNCCQSIASGKALAPVCSCCEIITTGEESKRCYNCAKNGHKCLELYVCFQMGF